MPICQDCGKYHQSCKDLQTEIRTLREWKHEAQISLGNWYSLGKLLESFFPLRIGDNMPIKLEEQIRATALVLRRMLNL